MLSTLGRASRTIISLCVTAAALSAGQAVAVDLNQAVANLKASKRAMFVCWSLSTFTDREWTSGTEPISTFNPTGCDTDQWARTARAAGMNSIMFLTKHHDGFALWDTATTSRKVTNSPLGIDVLAQVRQSCDKYGLGLGLYYSGGDWTWPGATDGASGPGAGGYNPEVKKAELRDLLTNYGDIDYMWFDAAVGDGGLSDQDTVDFVHGIQSDCVVATLTVGEMHDRNNLPPSPVVPPGFLMNDVSQPLLGMYDRWFYTNPGRDNEARSAQDIFNLYNACEEAENLLLLDVGPDRAGKLRAIDVSTLTTVGQMIGVPEPSSLAMIFGLGVGLLTYVWWKGRGF